MKSKQFIFSFLIIFVSSATSAVALPGTNKQFEWGGGFLNIYGNHYRGSDQSKLWTFPIPYFTYKSDKLEAEPSFVRGVIFHNNWFSFKLSLMLGLNVESKNNKARAGMPSLDYSIEAGPMFIFHIWKAESKKLHINIECPVRESFATDLTYLKPIGLFAVPYINIIHTPEPSPSILNWTSEFSVSPMYADQKYHQYFYGVDQKYIRTGRPFYKAHGGFSGYQTAIVLNKRIDQLVIIPFFRWDYLKTSVFYNSPLVKKNNYALAGLGLFWLFN
ncbi:MAG: MipA/OmpV family protein [Bacteriovorax sp.]|nr:MipA/OmpV family protein [Bacteriovorax sp.]